MIKRIILASLAVLAMTGRCDATHVWGADITYRAIDSLKYEVDLRIYRQCSGVVLGNSSSTFFIGCAANRFMEKMYPTLISIRDITPVCDSIKQPCYPSNKYATGDGLEVHLYRDTLDLTSSKFDSLRQNCCRVLIEYGACCRTDYTGSANQNYYTYAEINICSAPKNSSPRLTTDPFWYFCCNQPLYYNIGVSDTIDFDSLSYSFAPSLTSRNSYYGYNKIFSYRNPFTPYDPTGKGVVNQNANPPIGIFLDPETGDFIATPNKCNESGPLVFKVTEWRLDSSGKYYVIGVTRQDLFFRVATCKKNNPPIVNGPYAYNVCAQTTLCFHITTDDKVVKPPPPAKSPPPDTVTLSWNKGIPMATFKIVNDSALHQTGKFCWTPKEEDARSLPYTFTVRAQDNNCPIRTSSYRAFTVLVKPRARAKVDISSIGCSKYVVSAKLDSNFRTPAKYTWQVLDKNGKVIEDNRIAPYFPWGYWISKNAIDTIQFRHPGTYIIQLRMNNKSNCPVIYEDTLTVNSVFESRIASKSDTFHCSGEDLLLVPKHKNPRTPISFLWSTGDTTPQLTYRLNDTLAIDTLRVEFTDAIGCFAFDEVEVLRRENPKVEVQTDTLLCEDQQVTVQSKSEYALWDDPRTPDTTLVQQGSTLSFEWTHSGIVVGKDSSITVNQFGDYILRISDSSNCYAEDTFTLNHNEVKVDAGPDLSVCTGTKINLIPSYFDSIVNRKTGFYKWRDITDSLSPVDVSDSFRLIDQDRRLELKITLNQNGVICSKTDTVFYTAIALPTIVMPDDLTHCCDNGTINLKSLENAGSSGGTWSSRDTSLIKSVSWYDAGPCKSEVEVDTLFYFLTDTSTGCSSRDSFHIVVQPLPPSGLNSLDICSGIDSLDPVNDGLTASNVKWADYQYDWACANCSNGFWDSLYSDSGNDPRFKVGTPVFNLDDNSFASINLILSLRDSFGCSNVDTTILRVLGEPKIDRSLFKGSEPYQLCSEDGILLLQTNDYPSVWTLQNGGVISDNKLVLDTMTTGGNKLILKAGYGCSSDTVDFELFKTEHIDFLGKDTSILSRLDLSMVLKIKAQNVSQINWFTISSATLDVSSGLQNIIFFPHNKTIDLIEVPVWIKSGSNSPCEDKVDTTVFTLRPDPCSFFSASKVGEVLKLIPTDTIRYQYVWILSNGQSSKVKYPEFAFNLKDSAINVSLKTFNRFGDSCTITQWVDLHSLGVEELSGLRVFPNPVTGFLKITGLPVKSGIRYEIHDIAGRRVEKGELLYEQIDCNHLKSGTYTLRISVGGNTAHAKFQKLH